MHEVTGEGGRGGGEKERGEERVERRRGRGERGEGRAQREDVTRLRSRRGRGVRRTEGRRQKDGESSTANVAGMLCDTRCWERHGRIERERGAEEAEAAREDDLGFRVC